MLYLCEVGKLQREPFQTYGREIYHYLLVFPVSVTITYNTYPPYRMFYPAATREGRPDFFDFDSPYIGPTLKAAGTVTFSIQWQWFLGISLRNLEGSCSCTLEYNLRLRAPVSKRKSFALVMPT